jgi:hypothetical protein
MIFRKFMLTWLLIIAFGLAILRLESVVFGQYVNPAKAEDYESMHDYLKPRTQFIETLPWSEVTTNDFNHPAGEDIADHLRNHPMLGNELEKLHEWLHQKVERLRPVGSHAFILVEATESDFANWSNRRDIEAAGGWKIVRSEPVRSGIRNVVAIGKQHFSHAGYLTNAALRKIVTQFQNRQFKPIKSARARYVSKVTMYTRSNCSWCDKWMATEYQQAIADGVQVEFVNDENGSVPRFEVCDENGQCRQYTGFTLWSRMKST